MVFLDDDSKICDNCGSMIAAPSEYLRFKNNNYCCVDCLKDDIRYLCEREYTMRWNDAGHNIICDAWPINGCSHDIEGGDEYYVLDGQNICSDECLADMLYDKHYEDITTRELKTADAKRWEYDDWRRYDA